MPGGRARDSRFGESSSDRLSGHAIAVLAVLAPTIGGGIGLRSSAMLFAALGCLLLIAPPQKSLGAIANLICLSLILLAASAWLPAHWFTPPFWRSILEGQFQVALPATRSPQPWLTLEASCVLLANISCAYFMFTHPWNKNTRGIAVRVFCAGILLLTAVALGSYWTGHKIPLWPRVMNSTADFGFFVNRNQTANVLALSGILLAAISFDDLRGGRKRAVFWLAGIAMIGVALVIAYSRAGIVLFFAGVFAWALASIRFSNSAKYLAVMLTAMLLLLAVFFSFGGNTLKRFQSPAGAGVRDFRIPIQQDALQLSARAPWLGSGLGNFEPLFRLVRDKSRQQDYALHPDSDWLWTAVDLGWMAVAALLIGLVLWISRCFPFDSRESAALRLAAMVYGLGFAAAGFVDVSGHRIGTFWPALFVMGLAMRSDRSEIKSRWIPPLFRCAGLILLAIAACWAAPTMRFTSVPTSDTLAGYQRTADFDFEGADYDHLIETSTAALRIAPLDWHFYSQRAIAKANLAEPDAAIRDFRTARFLQPHFVDSCEYEGSLWFDLDQPAYALEAWKEALNRAPDGGAYLFSAILSAAASRPEIVAQMKTWALGDPGLELVVLTAAPPEEFQPRLEALLLSDPELKRLSPEERKTLFKVWAQKGDAAKLTAMLRAHPQWEKEEWRILARQFASGGDFRRAYETATTLGPKPALPKTDPRRTRADIERDLAHSPDDLVAGLALYGLQIREDSLEDALNTIQQLKDGQPKLRYLSFMEAELHAKKEDWKSAWTAWEEFGAGSE